MRIKVVLRNPIACLLFVFGTVSCAVTLKVHVMPHPNHEGVYLAIYKPADRLLDEYGNGSEKMYKSLRGASPETVKQIWNAAYGYAIQKYLEVNHRIPQECHEGIYIDSSSPDEGGGGATSFRCK